MWGSLRCAGFCFFTPRPSLVYTTATTAAAAATATATATKNC